MSTDDESNDSEHEVLTHRGVATTRRHVHHGHAAAQAQDGVDPARSRDIMDDMVNAVRLARIRLGPPSRRGLK